MKIKSIFAVLSGTIWISISEFVRNELLFKSYWTEYFQTLKLTLPDTSVNGIVWGVWPFLFAVATGIWAYYLTDCYLMQFH